MSLSLKKKELKKFLKSLLKDNYSEIQKRVVEAHRIASAAQEASPH